MVDPGALRSIGFVLGVAIEESVMEQHRRPKSRVERLSLFAERDQFLMLSAWVLVTTFVLARMVMWVS